MPAVSLKQPSNAHITKHSHRSKWRSENSLPCSRLRQCHVAKAVVVSLPRVSRGQGIKAAKGSPCGRIFRDLRFSSDLLIALLRCEVLNKEHTRALIFTLLVRKLLSVARSMPISCDRSPNHHFRST